MSVKNDQLIFKFLRCNKNQNKNLNKDLINRFGNTNKFYDGDINKFIFLLRKGFYPYDYRNSWKRVDEILILNKEDFYSSLNMESIADVHYRHENKEFKI